MSTVELCLIIVSAVALCISVICCVAVVVRKQRKRDFEPHFRKFHDKITQGHPQYIYDEEGNKYRVIGVTHAPKTNGVLNIRLKVNPEPGNNSPAYMRPTTDEIDKGTRSKRLTDWKLSRRDKRKAKKVIRDSKKAKK